MKKYLVLAVAVLAFTHNVNAQTLPIAPSNSNYYYNSNYYNTNGGYYSNGYYITPNYGTTYPAYQTSTVQPVYTDLAVGSSGSDVIQLQEWLIAHGFDIPAITSGRTAKGSFGQQTKAALQAFQRSVGLEETGILGPTTRARMGWGTAVYTTPSYTYPQYPTYNQYSYGVPTINSVVGPTTLQTNQFGTWTVRATDSGTTYNSFLTTTIDWGDGSRVDSTSSYTSVMTFTHSYALPGAYNIKVTVRNSGNFSTQSYASVQVYGSSVSGGGPIQVTSPNGGEIWQRGTVQTIRWNSPLYIQATYGDIRLLRYNVCTSQICPAIAYAPYTIATNISLFQNSYTWFVGNVVADPTYTSLNSVPDGQYTIQICERNSGVCDTSDGVFTIRSY